MSPAIASSALASFIALSIGGICTSGYLVWKHHRSQKTKAAPLVCPLNHDCSTVTESKWSTIFYFRNETLGLLYYVAMFMGGLLLAFAPALIPALPLFLLIGAGMALLFSFFLVYLQAFIIKDYCFYCLISAIISLLLVVNSFLIFV
ncbi:MAG: vitamin K epoxide reductase family protein [Nanoarchaeota archaeon]